MCDVRDAIHLCLDRNGDLLLDFLGCMTGPLGDDVDVRVGDVRIRCHRKGVKRDCPPDELQYPKAKDQPAVLKREIDQRANHADVLIGFSCYSCWIACENARALRTTSRPRGTPLSTT